MVLPIRRPGAFQRTPGCAASGRGARARRAGGRGAGLLGSAGSRQRTLGRITDESETWSRFGRSFSEVFFSERPESFGVWGWNEDAGARHLAPISGITGRPLV